MHGLVPGAPFASAAMAISLTWVLATCTVVDLRRRLVPDRVVTAGGLVALLSLALAAPGLLDERVIAALGAGAFLLVPALIRPGAMGLGDAKLAAMLGLYLGGAVAVALLVAFVAGTLAGLLLLLRHGPAARKMTIPFVPYLALGAVVALA